MAISRPATSKESFAEASLEVLPKTQISDSPSTAIFNLYSEARSSASAGQWSLPVWLNIGNLYPTGSRYTSTTVNASSSLNYLRTC